MHNVYMFAAGFSSGAALSVLFANKVKAFLGFEAAKAKALGEKEFDNLRKKL